MKRETTPGRGIQELYRETGNRLQAILDRVDQGEMGEAEGQELVLALVKAMRTYYVAVRPYCDVGRLAQVVLELSNQLSAIRLILESTDFSISVPDLDLGSDVDVEHNVYPVVLLFSDEPDADRSPAVRHEVIDYHHCRVTRMCGADAESTGEFAGWLEQRRYATAEEESLEHYRQLARHRFLCSTSSSLSAGIVLRSEIVEQVYAGAPQLREVLELWGVLRPLDQGAWEVRDPAAIGVSEEASVVAKRNRAAMSAADHSVLAILGRAEPDALPSDADLGSIVRACSDAIGVGDIERAKRYLDACLRRLDPERVTVDLAERGSIDELIAPVVRRWVEGGASGALPIAGIPHAARDLVSGRKRLLVAIVLEASVDMAARRWNQQAWGFASRHRESHGREVSS